MYKIAVKNPEGSKYKYSKIGHVLEGKFGLFGKFSVEYLEQAIANAKKNNTLEEFKGKYYLSFTLFEDDKKTKVNDNPISQPVSDNQIEIDDEIPF